MRSYLLLPFALLSLACNAVKAPTAVVQSASVGSVTPQALTLNLNLLISNPNAFAIPLTNTSYSLTAANTEILQGTADPHASVPAGGAAPLTLPITINWADLLKAKSAIIASGGNLPYSVAGKLNLASDSPLAFLGDRASVPLSYAGTLPLRDYLADPRILLNSPAAQELAKSALGRLGF